VPNYPDLDELDKLWPDEGYAVIIEDEWKPPYSDDFVNILGQFSPTLISRTRARATHTGYTTQKGTDIIEKSSKTTKQ
jgi:hypothetical protein